jgi:SAM-dependent methyltransferase
VTDAVADRVKRYILDGSDADLRRLLRIAELMTPYCRAALERVGVQPGWRAIECGCGPIGALAVLADIVGPSGQVLGVDFSEPTVQRAKAVVETLGLSNVDVVAGDVNELDPTMVSGPFDIAFARCFLMHQPDPVHTLSRIGQLLRPGGWVVAQEPLRDPPPMSHPHLAALVTYWEFLHDLTAQVGVPRDVVNDLPRSAVSAGLEAVGQNGFFALTEPAVGFELHAMTLTASKDRAVQWGIASPADIDAVVDAIRAAKNGDYQWVTSPIFLDFAFRKPDADL